MTWSIFLLVNGNGNDLWMVRLHGKSFFYKFPSTKTEIEKGVSINCVAVFSEFWPPPPWLPNMNILMTPSKIYVNLLPTPPLFLHKFFPIFA